MSDSAIQVALEERPATGLEEHIKDLLREKDYSAATYFYSDFGDHAALGRAIVEAIPDTTGTYRTFEDGIRQHWSPTRNEELAFTRFLTEYEAIFWSVRREVLHAHPEAVDSVEEFLASLDQEIRREILVRIEAGLPAPKVSDVA